MMQNVKVTQKGKKGPVPARIFFILARNSPTAVVLRKGPSKWVQVLKWDIDTDTFEAGQWFHGRIYERRSDLSPDGSMLVYFAQKISGRTLQDTEYTYAWTAVSRPPYITALALWPKGDCWHGGGLFQDNKTLILNHKSDVAKPHPNHIPHGLQVILKNGVYGEDDPLFSERLQRDGWNLKQEWVVEYHGYPLGYTTHQPDIREKFNEDGSMVIRLTRSIENHDYAEEFAVSNGDGSTLIHIEGASWVDWDFRGRLVFARDGKIFEGQVADSERLSARELADLNSATPATVRSPDWASRW
ncbi:MAG: hypothetical protein ABR990_13755 [Terracidiphilus sp.]|jgi:hypothetical protein